MVGVKGMRRGVKNIYKGGEGLPGHTGSPGPPGLPAPGGAKLDGYQVLDGYAESQCHGHRIVQHAKLRGGSQARLTDGNL